MDMGKMHQAASDLIIIGEELVKAALVLEDAQYGHKKPGLTVKLPADVSGTPYFIEIRQTTVEEVLQWMSTMESKDRR